MTQSEEILEQGLIKPLTGMSYEFVSIKEEDNLYSNFKTQLENGKRVWIKFIHSPHWRQNLFQESN